MSRGPAERFRATSGPVLGTLGLLLVAVVVAVGLLDRSSGLPTPAVWAALVVGVLLWASMMRPQVVVGADELVLRNMLETVSVPLAAVEQVIVGQVLAVGTAEGRYLCPAVGRSWRQTAKASAARRTGQELQETSGRSQYADYVESRISQFAEDARARHGVRLMSTEQQALASDVRRERAWPEIVALVVSTGGFVVSLLV